jgi:DNA polymerase III alpha subunit
MADRTDDPLMLLARQRIISLSAELEVQLTDRRGSAPVVEIITRLRERAAESLAALATVDLFSEKGRAEAVTFQNEVKRYDEFFGEIRRIVSEGIQLDQQARETEREQTLDMLQQRPDGERIAIELGLVDGIENLTPVD